MVNRDYLCLFIHLKAESSGAAGQPEMIGKSAVIHTPYSTGALVFVVGLLGDVWEFSEE